jgi:GNAT superfamily N-acetyltransferase
MKATLIRPAEFSDRDQIVEFNFRLAEETEHRALDRSILESGVSALLRDRDKGRYYLAESDEGQVIGQMMITLEWSDWRDGWFWWLQSVYVLPECRKQGVFSALFAHVRELALAEPEVCGLRLYVDQDNSPAQSTYGSRGFHRANYAVMEMVIRH